MGFRELHPRQGLTAAAGCEGTRVAAQLNGFDERNPFWTEIERVIRRIIARKRSFAARSYSREDMNDEFTQEILLTLVDHPMPTHIRNPMGWLYRVATNERLDIIRKYQRLQAHYPVKPWDKGRDDDVETDEEAHYVTGHEHSDPTAQSYLDKEDLNSVWDEILAIAGKGIRRPGLDKRAMVLLAALDYPDEEIAQRLHVTTKCVENAQSRLRKAILLRHQEYAEGRTLRGPKRGTKHGTKRRGEGRGKGRGKAQAAE
ncbi:MAG: RNA polymerase sigma factor [Ktedonobacterales bacterium]